MDMQKFWDQQAGTGTWAGYYDGAQTAKTYNFFTRRQTVRKLLEPDGRFERALDVGCGTGDYAPIVLDHDGQFFGIDFAPEMIRQAVDRVGGQGEQHLCLVGMGHQLPFADRSFDLVMALGYIEYFEDPTQPMEEIRRVMKPGGTLVMQSFKWELFGNLGRKVVGPLKRAIRGKPAAGNPMGLPPDWVDKKYSKSELDALMRRHGFHLVSGSYNNFHCLPRRLRGRLPGLYTRGSEFLGKLAPSMFGFLAVNYIAKYQLESPGA